MLMPRLNAPDHMRCHNIWARRLARARGHFISCPAAGTPTLVARHCARTSFGVALVSFSLNQMSTKPRTCATTTRRPSARSVSVRQVCSKSAVRVHQTDETLAKCRARPPFIIHHSKDGAPLARAHTPLFLIHLHLKLFKRQRHTRT